MKLVIDIPKDEYNEIINDNYIPDGNFRKNCIITIRNSTPLDDIKAEIQEEKEFAYADFEQYKVDYLGCDAEYVKDELPNDDYRYGMERCLEIIDQYIGKRSK